MKQNSHINLFNREINQIETERNKSVKEIIL